MTVYVLIYLWSSVLETVSVFTTRERAEHQFKVSTGQSWDTYVAWQDDDRREVLSGLHYEDDE